MNVYRRERLKTICVGLLFVLLLGILLLNFLYDRDDLIGPLLNQLNAPASEIPSPSVGILEPLPDAIYPVAAALRRDCVLLGGNGDSGAVDTLYEMFRSLLGMVLASAQDPSAVTQDEWRDALQHDGAYFRFRSSVPAWLLAESLSQEVSASLSALSLDRLLLGTSQDGELLLFLDTGEDILRFGTPLTFRLPESGEHSSLLSVAHFALELDMPANVAPDTLFTEQPAVIPTLVPDNAQSDASLPALLTAFDFNPNTDNRYTAASGEQVIVDDQRSIHISPDGTVSYRDSSAPRRASSTSSPSPVRDALIIALNSIPGGAAFWGEGRLCLQSVEESPDGIVVVMSYLWHGAYVTDSESVFIVKDGVLVDAVLKVKPLFAASESVPVMPQRQAALLLPSGSGLTLGYRMNEDGVYVPCWLYY